MYTIQCRGLIFRHRGFVISAVQNRPALALMLTVGYKLINPGLGQGLGQG